MAAFDHELPRIASDTPAFPVLLTPTSSRPLLSVLSTCPGCSEAFDDSTRAPRVLKQCGHTICDRCVHTNTTRTSTDDVVVICGHIRGGVSCGRETRVKEGERLAINLVLLEFLASLREDAPSGGCSHFHFPKLANITKNQQQHDEAPKCDECDDFGKKAAEFRCLVDNASYCSKCWDSTHQSRTQKTHQRMPITGDGCLKHATERVDRNCTDGRCSQRGSVMCKQCEDVTAHGHAGTLIDSGMVAEKRGELQRVVEELQSRMAEKWVLWSKTYSALHDAMTVLNTSDDWRFLSSYWDVHEQVALVVGECAGEQAEVQRLQQLLDVAEHKLTEQARDEAQRRSIEAEAEWRINEPQGLGALVAFSSGTLDLSGKQIRDDECQSICHGLKINSTLTTLYLHNNQIGDAGCRDIGDALKINSTLTTLYLYCNQIGDAGCTAIGDALKINSTLTTLGLSNNRIGDAGCTAIGDALKINSTLTTLGLSNNEIGNAGCTAIGDALKLNSTLTTLGLHNNEIGDAGCTAISDALKINSTLTTLGLHNNQIGDAGCTAIKSNPVLTTLGLTRLDLHNNQIGDTGCTAIGDALKINSTLTELYLHNNQIGEVAKKLVRSNFGSRQKLVV